ncbi:hypothetical protein [Streptomyces sp. YS-3]
MARQLTAHGHQLVHCIKEDSRLPTGEPVRIGDLAGPDSLGPPSPRTSTA